jgi:hypothetical protein
MYVILYGLILKKREKHNLSKEAERERERERERD